MLFDFLWTFLLLKEFVFALLHILLSTLLVEILLILSFGKGLLKSLLYKTGLILLFWEKRIFLDLWISFGLFDDYRMIVILLFLIWVQCAIFSALVELFACFDVFLLHFGFCITVYAQNKTLLVKYSSFGLLFDAAATNVAFNESM